MALRTLRDRQLALALIVLLATMITTVAQAAVHAHGIRLGFVGDARRQALRTPVRQTLVVPQVTKSAFVFAKVTLSDAGFGWRVVGPVAGYPSSVVASQWPAPGTKVVDTGAPLVVVHLRRNPGYPPTGAPENRPPYRGTRVLLAR